jgi:hypothetical protein
MKFSIRDLLWLTLLAAVVAAWWIDREQPTALWPFTASRSLKLVPAEGTITCRGEPLAEAQIAVRYPDGKTAVAVSDAQGHFALAYDGQGGAMPGDNLPVTVRMVPTSVRRTAEVDPRFIDFWPSTGDGKSELPPAYAESQKSPLRIAIPKKGSRQLWLELK